MCKQEVTGAGKPRNNRALDKPLITIEERGGSIRQCYGFRDTINSSPEIRDFISEYASLKNLKIKAKIMAE